MVKKIRHAAEDELLSSIYGSRSMSQPLTKYLLREFHVGAGEVGSIAVLILLFVRDHPPEIRSDRIPTTGTVPASITKNFRSVVANPQAWINALYATAISIIFFLGAIPGGMFFGRVSEPPGLITVSFSGPPSPAS